MPARPEIEALAQKIVRRHNAFLVFRSLIVALLFASCFVVIASLFYVTRGHSVPWQIPSLAAIILLATTAVWVFIKRIDKHSAVIEADRFFGLKDAITTARHLAIHAPGDSATQLQWKWLSPRLANCDPRAIKRPLPKRLSAIAAVLALAAITLCLLPPSDAIRAAEQQAEATRERVAESKEELQKLIEELDKEIIAAGEKEGLDMDEFRKMVNAIEETGDRTEAARQFARIERKVRDASRSLDQQRDEETMKLAAKELKKSEDTDARKLGKKLEDKELKEAAEMLEKLAAKKLDPKDFKKGAKQKKKALDEAKKDLAKMRAASKRMAAAGKQRQAARQAQGAGAAANANGAADGQGGGEGKALEEMLVELDEAAAELEENLEEMEFDPDAEFDDEAGEAMAGMKGMLGKKMRRMNGKRLAKSKLDALRAALAQAQANAQGQGQQQSNGPGGKEAGVGSSWAERKEKDDSQKNGSLAQLQGTHGEGPSLSAVEDSDSGSGISTRKGTAKERDFSRQMESFVQRDDVPESLKLGVRNYFENLQSATAE